MTDKDFDSILKEKRLSFFQRLLNVFINPKRIMENISVKPTVLIPILMMTAVFLLLNIARFDLFKEFSTQQLMDLGRVGNSEINELSQEIMMTSLYINTIIASLSPLIGIIFKGAVIFGIVQLFGGKGNFKSNISVVAFSYFILTLGEIIRTIIGLLTETYMVTTSLAAAIPNLQMGTPLYVLLGSIDVFSIWYLIVSTVGIAIVNGISKGRAAAAVFIPWLLLIAYNLAIAGIRMM